MKKVMALKPGDTIGIAASSSPFDRKLFMKGVHVLEGLGFKTFYRHDIFDQNRYLAGTDARRAEELIELFTAKEIKAIMFARGGYGSQRIIPLIDLEKVKAHPKPVIGFSDLTALLGFLRQDAGVPTFYGPVITQLGKITDASTAEMLFKCLTVSGTIGSVPMAGAKVIRPGSAEGALVGGCISLINSSMGTPYELDTKDSVFFLEDVGEKVYVLDRMLTQLKNSGKLSLARAMIFGSLIPPPEEPYDTESMIRDVLSDFRGPIITNFPAGHGDRFVTLPMGATVSIEAADGQPPKMEIKTGLLI